MRQVRIQERHKRLVTIVGAAIAASGLLSAFQPASAQVLETSWAVARQQQGDFAIRLSVQEHRGGQVCAFITDLVTGDSHSDCGPAFESEVSDTLDSARGRGTIEWSDYFAGNGGSQADGANRFGTIALDITWASSGELETNLHPQGDPLDPLCWISWEPGPSCTPWAEADQTREATASGTVTDSEWGTFILEGAIGSMWQNLI